MNIEELKSMFGIESQDKSMKNPTKAKEIIEKILACPKCKTQMNWVEGTNVCACPTCTYSVGKNENKKIYSVSKILSEKSYKFLENNKKYIARENAEV